MSAMDRFTEFDATVAAIRNEHELEVKNLQTIIHEDKIKLTLIEQAMQEAKEERKIAVKIATQLVTQFSTVEKVFADAKRLAMQVDAFPEHNPDGAAKAFCEWLRLQLTVPRQHTISFQELNDWKLKLEREVFGKEPETWIDGSPVIKPPSEPPFTGGPVKTMPIVGEHPGETIIPSSAVERLRAGKIS